MKVFAFLLSFVVLVGCTKKIEDDMSDKSLSLVTHCVGRHLISVPASYSPAPVVTGIFREAGLKSRASDIDVIVRPIPATHEAFMAEVARHEGELRSLSSDSVDVLKLAKSLKENAFVFRVQQIDDAYTSEMYLWLGEALVVMRVDSFENQFELAENRLIELARSISLSKPDMEHGAKNFCLGRVRISADFTVEQGSFSFVDHEGNAFDLDVDTFSRNDNKLLLSRMSGPDSLLSLFKVDHRIFRKGERTVAGMRAQEWLGSATVREGPNAESLAFVLETMRSQPGKARPLLHLEFETGRALKDGSRSNKVLADAAALTLWDTVVASLRFNGDPDGS